MKASSGSYMLALLKQEKKRGISAFNWFLFWSAFRWSQFIQIIKLLFDFESTLISKTIKLSISNFY